MKLTLEQLKGMLRVDKHSLDDELEAQAQIAYSIAESASQATASLAALKEELDEVDAELQVELRDGAGKKTVGEIAAEITLDRNHQKAFHDYQAAKRECELWNGMVEAWRARGFSLKTLADLHTAGYFAVNSAGKETSYKADRQVLAENRQSRRRVVVA